MHPSCNEAELGYRASVTSEAGNGVEYRRSKRVSIPEPVVSKKTFKPVFVDANAMKARLREQMLKKEYDVSVYYHRHGSAQRLARSSYFEKVSLVIIFLNAIWIGIAADYNDAAVLLDASPPIQVVENLFCLFFTAEILIRLLAFADKRNCLKDAWFVFDSSLVALMVGEIWVMTLALLAAGGEARSSMNLNVLRLGRLLRMSRMARMARLLRMMPELLVLLKGMFVAIRSVFFTLVLLVLLTYVFAIAFKETSVGSQSGQLYFSSMSRTMHNLIAYGTFLDDLAEMTEVLQLDAEKYGAFYLIFMFYVYVLLSALTVMNMLIGILCEVVGAVSAGEREQMTISVVKEKLERIMKIEFSKRARIIGRQSGTGAWHTEGREIDVGEFTAMLENVEAADALREVGVDVIGLVDIADIIFDETENRTISFAKLMDLILDLRGSNTATVKDVVNLRKYIRSTFHALEEELQGIARVGACRPSGWESMLDSDAQEGEPAAARHSPRQAATPERKNSKGSRLQRWEEFHAIDASTFHGQAAPQHLRGAARADGGVSWKEQAVHLERAISSLHSEFLNFVQACDVTGASSSSKYVPQNGRALPMEKGNNTGTAGPMPPNTKIECECLPLAPAGAPVPLVRAVADGDGEDSEDSDKSEDSIDAQARRRASGHRQLRVRQPPKDSTGQPSQVRLPGHLLGDLGSSSDEASDRGELT